ncbi:unnamed protein product [Penicillium olsonii]|nr:unnamed protein product [Penicillium olsonii]
MEASSIWKVSNHGDCDRLKAEVSKSAFMNLAVEKSVPVKLDGKVFTTWAGATNERDTGMNCIGILTLGWCYILSARLIELRGEGASLRYTESQAQYDHGTFVESSTTSNLDVGKVDDDVARWWSAILAPKKGWKAIVTDESLSWVAPWCISRKCERAISIKHNAPTSGSVSTPLSSQRAFEVLSEFALLHDLGSQFPISLAAALMIPAHGYYGWGVHLPSPTTKKPKEDPNFSMRSVPQAWLGYIGDIEYYMSLSCAPERMFAILCGPFWEPEVPCNLVSPWLHPALNEVTTNSSTTTAHDQETADDQEILTLLCALRRPSIGALCIGAAISGLSPKIISSVGSGQLPVDQHAFAWTGSPQCFHDLPGMGPYRCEDSEFIARQDVWRLLHLPTTDPEDWKFDNRPFGGWAPCGKSLSENCDIQVVLHLDCRRHEYQYDHWRWHLEDGSFLDDYGFSRDLMTPVPEGLSDVIQKATQMTFEKKDFDAYQKASKGASFKSFIWLFNKGGGVPSEPVYQDDWIKKAWKRRARDEPIENEDEEEYDSESHARVQSWVDSIDI